MSHTKGPWRAGYDSESSRPTEMLVRAEEVDGQPWVAICRSNFGDIPIEANAQLIAAAPDLLEACREALPHLHWANTHGSRCDEAIASVEAAIAKATGGEKP